MNQRPPIVILTALQPEYQAVRDRLAGVHETRRADGTRFEIGSLDRDQVVLAAAGPGTDGAAVVAGRAIREFEPAAVLVLGTGGAGAAAFALALAADVHDGERRHQAALDAEVKRPAMDDGEPPAARQSGRIRVDRGRC